MLCNMFLSVNRQVCRQIFLRCAALQGFRDARYRQMGNRSKPKPKAAFAELVERVLRYHRLVGSAKSEKCSANGTKIKTKGTIERRERRELFSAENPRPKECRRGIPLWWRGRQAITASCAELLRYNVKNLALLSDLRLFLKENEKKTKPLRKIFKSSIRQTAAPSARRLLRAAALAACRGSASLPAYWQTGNK